MKIVFQWLKANRALAIVLGVCVVVSMISTLDILNRFTPVIDYQANYENLEDYPWYSVGLETPLRTDFYQLSAEWTQEKRFYLQMFGDKLQNLPKEYYNVAAIPEGSSKITFDCILVLPKNTAITGYIIQFNDSGKVLENHKKIEQIDTSLITTGNTSVTSRIVSLSAGLSPDARYYTVIFDVRPKGSGSLSIRDVDISFGGVV